MVKVFDRYKDVHFTKIIHLSDLHIRLYKRHHEYKIVFNRFYLTLDEWIKNNDSEVACIVITGDLVHSKTDLSPEMVELVSNFLVMLAKKLPVIIIAGNHDLNVANPHRLDSLSPIISNLKNDNIIYFKNSGIYEMGNLGFAVYSIFGSEDDWPIAHSMTQDVKIGLYHGPVHKDRKSVV